MKSFNHFLKLVKENSSNELLWMVCTIPPFDQWTELQSTVSAPDTNKEYSFEVDGQKFVITSNIDWFKDNVGKKVKFKYDPKTRENSSVHYGVIIESSNNPQIDQELVSIFISTYNLNKVDSEKVRYIIMSNYDGTPEYLMSKIKQISKIVNAPIYEIEEIFNQNNIYLNLESFNEGFNSSDLKNILTKYTQFLFDNNYTNDSLKGESIDKILNKFLNK